MGGLRLAGTAEHNVSEVTGQVEARRLKTIEGLGDRGKQMQAFGLFEECEGAGELDAEALGFASRSPLVEEENRPASVCELDGLPLAGPEVPR